MTHNIPMFSSLLIDQQMDYMSPIKRVLDSHWYVLGKEVEAFEHEFAEYCGVLDCISVASGTDALELGLRACGVGLDDDVLLVANAGYYGSTAINLIGANPVYIDIDPVTLTMSVDCLTQKLNNIKPKAIIVTHLYGQLADIESIVKLAAKQDIAVVEDCAQAHGARKNGKIGGSFGALGCYSFYPTKNLGALGDGGAIVSNNSDILTRLRQLRQYGWSYKYKVEVSGGRNSRLDELQAAILRAKLPLLDSWNDLRRHIATTYNRAFIDLPVICPPHPNEEHVSHLYVLRLDNRTEFRDFLSKHGIATDVHYRFLDHQQNICPSKHYQLPQTEIVGETVVSLPCYPGLKDSETAYVISIVENYFLEVSIKEKPLRNQLSCTK